MGWATAAVIGANIIGGAVSSKQKSKAINRAATTQAAASRNAQDTVRQNFLDTVDLLRPRMAAGDAAIGQMMFELGLSDSPQIPQAAMGQIGPQRSDYGAYLEQNPDVAAEASRQAGFGFQDGGVPLSYDVNGDYTMQPEEYAAFHYERFGQNEGRELPNVIQPGQAAQPGQGQGQGDPEGRFDRFRETPGYQFQMEEGLRAVEGSAAARGGLLRGSTLQRLQQTGQGIADQTYNQYFNRLAGLAGIGGQATNAVAAAGERQASSIANLISGQGQTDAQAQIARGANSAQMWGDIGNAAGQLAGGVNWGNVFGGGGGKPSSFNGFAGGTLGSSIG